MKTGIYYSPNNFVEIYYFDGERVMYLGADGEWSTSAVTKDSINLVYGWELIWEIQS